MYKRLRIIYQAVIITVLGACCQDALAQLTVKGGYLDVFAATYVKSLDEFIQRFNGDEFHPDLDTTRVDNLRMRSILSLVDRQQFEVQDSIVAQSLINFADTVCSNNIFVDLQGGTYAEAECTFTYEEREHHINLIVEFEHLRDDYFRWALVGANGLIDAHLLDASAYGYLNPTQHEVRFTELTAINADNMGLIAFDKQIDQLSYLAGMLKTGQMKFLDCNRVRFHFMQVPNYVFEVEESNRPGNNSGYLIIAVHKVSREEKLAYINHLVGTETKLIGK